MDSNSTAPSSTSKQIQNPPEWTKKLPTVPPWNPFHALQYPFHAVNQRRKARGRGYWKENPAQLCSLNVELGYAYQEEKNTIKGIRRTHKEEIIILHKPLNWGAA